MPADDDRREVARRLREMPNSATWTPDRFGEALLQLLVCGNGRESFNRLADLIEPSCDRDALLGVLDEMDVTIRYAGPDVERDCVESWAGRIREALGVER